MKLFKWARYGLLLLIVGLLVRGVLGLSEEAEQSRQIMGGTYGRGPKGTAVGHLGGVPVTIPPGFKLRLTSSKSRV